MTIKDFETDIVIPHLHLTRIEQFSAGKIVDNVNYPEYLICKKVLTYVGTKKNVLNDNFAIAYKCASCNLFVIKIIDDKFKLIIFDGVNDPLTKSIYNNIGFKYTEVE